MHAGIPSWGVWGSVRRAVLADHNQRAATSKGAVCVSYDDGRVEQMAPAEAAAELGQRLTFFITTGLLGSAGYMTDADVVDLHEMGHEIGAHSVNHDSYRDDLTAAQRAEDMDTSRDYLEQLTQAPVPSFAYPYGHRTETIDREVYGHFWNAAGVTQSASPYWLPNTRPFLFYRQQWSESFHPYIYESVNLAATQPLTVAPYTHIPGNNPGTANVRALGRLAADLGVPMLGVSEVFPSGPPIRNPLPLGTAGGWLPTVTGTGTGAVTEGSPPTGTPGDHVFRFDTNDSSSSAYYRQALPAVPGRTFTLSAWVRGEVTDGDDTVNPSLRVTAVKTTTDEISREGISTTDLDGEWHRVEASITPDADTYRIDLDLLFLSATGWAEFCHVSWDETRFGTFGG